MVDLYSKYSDWIYPLKKLDNLDLVYRHNSFLRYHKLKFSINIKLGDINISTGADFSILKFDNWCKKYCEGNYLMLYPGQYFELDSDRINFILQM